MEILSVSWSFFQFHGVSLSFMEILSVSWSFFQVSWSFFQFHGASFSFMELLSVSWSFDLLRTRNKAKKAQTLPHKAPPLSITDGAPHPLPFS